MNMAAEPRPPSLPRTCSNLDGSAKQAHATRDSARAAAKRTHAASGATMKAYHCPNCSSWHVAHRTAAR